MTNPTPKQMVVQSLKALSKARTRTLFKLKALRGKRRDISAEEHAARLRLDEIHRKMTWEIQTNGKTLGDKA